MTESNSNGGTYHVKECRRKPADGRHIPSESVSEEVALQEIREPLAEESRTPRLAVLGKEVGKALPSVRHQLLDGHAARIDRLTDEHENLLAEPEILGA